MDDVHDMIWSGAYAKEKLPALDTACQTCEQNAKATANDKEVKITPNRSRSYTPSAKRLIFSAKASSADEPRSSPIQGRFTPDGSVTPQQPQDEEARSSNFHAAISKSGKEDQIKSAIDWLHTELSVLHKANVSLQDHIKKAEEKAALAEGSRLEAENAHRDERSWLLKEASGLRENEAKLKVGMEDLQTALNRLHTFNELLQDQIRKAEEKVRHSEEALETKTEEEDVLLEQLSEAKKELYEMGAKLDALENELSQLQCINLDLEEQLIKADENIKNLQVTFEQKVAELVKEKKKDLEELAAKIIICQAEMAQLKGANATLDGQLKESNEKATILEECLEETKAAEQFLHDRVNSLEEELAENARLEQKVAFLEAQSSELRSDNETLHDQITTALEKAKNLQKSLEEASVAEQFSHERMNNLQDENTRMEKTIAELQDELAGLRSENANLEDRVEKLIAENEARCEKKEEEATPEVKEADVSNGFHKMVETLQEIKADLPQLIQDRLQSVQSRATELGEDDSDNELYDQIATSHADPTMQTKFFEACYDGRLEDVQIMLTSKLADINGQYDRDKHGPVGKMSYTWAGMTGLMFACVSGHFDIAKYLIVEGASFNKRDLARKTALMRASENGHIDIVGLLLKQPEIEVNRRDNNRATALMFASEMGHFSIVAYLIEAGAEAEKKSRDGMTALLLAAENGFVGIVKYLAKQENVKINRKNKYGKTALMLAAENGHNDVVRYLVKDKHAMVNLQANDGMTAVMLAAKLGHVCVVRYLVDEGGAQLHFKNGEGMTARDIASCNGKKEIDEFLKRK